MIATVVLCLVGCAEEAEFVVEGHQAPCTGLFLTTCMVVDQGEGPSLYYDQIDGFAFQWGVRSRIRVEVHRIDDPPEDGSSIEHELIEVIDETPVQPGDTFELVLLPGWAEVAGDDFVMPNERRLRCDDAQLCDQIRDFLTSEATGVSARLTVAHPGDPTDAGLALEIVSATF